MDRSSLGARRGCVIGAVVVLLTGGPALVVDSIGPASAQVVSGRTDRLSVSDSGAEAVGRSFEPSVSADGNHVAFTTASPLDPLDGDDADLDVYVRDRRTETTIMLSRGQLTDDPGETKPNGESHRPSISASGRYVAFQSTAWNFATPDLDSYDDVVIVDRDPDNDGVFDERADDETVDYRYVTVGRMNYFPSFGRVWTGNTPSISADGTVVSWVQMSVLGPSLRSKPLLTFAMPDDAPIQGTVVTAVLGTGADGQLVQPAADHPYMNVDNGPPDYADNFSATEPVVSADGRRVVITAQLRPAGDSAAAGERAIVESTIPGGLTTRMDLMAPGLPVQGWVGEPTVSGNGRLVAFTWEDAATAQQDVLVVDRDTDEDGQLSATGNDEPFTLRIASRDVRDQPGGGLSPALSADGRYLAFVTAGRFMHGGVDGPDDRGRCDQARPTSVCDIVVRDLTTDVERELGELDRLPAELASPSLDRVCAPELPADSTCEADNDGSTPALSANGDTVVYASDATDLVADDTNDAADVFARQFSPTMIATPSALDFGTVLIGDDSTATATLDHTGFGPATVGAVSISGPDAEDFAVFPAETCARRTFHATGSCVVSVRFAPNGAGPRSASLRLLTPQGVPLGTVELTGGGDPPVLSVDVDQDVVAFGDRLVLTSSPPRAVTVRNIGNVALDIGEVALQPDTGVPAVTFPSDYFVAAQDCRGRSLGVGGSCVIVVTHVPRGTGSRPAVLLVNSDSETGSRLIRLEGGGSEPSLEVNPAVVRDGAVTTVSGKGFPLFRVITVTASGAPVEYRATTDGQGAFTLSYVVFPNASAGSRRIEARFADVRPAIAAAVEILVVPGSVAPPDFAERR